MQKLKNFFCLILAAVLLGVCVRSCIVLHCDLCKMELAFVWHDNQSSRPSFGNDYSRNTWNGVEFFIWLKCGTRGNLGIFILLSVSLPSCESLVEQYSSVIPASLMTSISFGPIFAVNGKCLAKKVGLPLKKPSHSGGNLPNPIVFDFRVSYVWFPSF